ncbi:hypothetical protein ILYODFUR_017552 [Ilyodon furcidens]|uniref:Secreted protein n=1 Tax=Ilyodon furcidens TaxID=33524 RepID=A0ABV0T8S8_9TELE
MCDCDCVCLFFVSGWVLGCSLSWISSGPPSNVGPIPSLPNYLPVVGVSAPGVLVVLSIRGWVLWCVLANSRWLLAGAWSPGPVLMSVVRISSISVPGPGGQVCGSSHSLLYIFMEKPCKYKHAHTQTHKCLDSGDKRYINVLY